MATDNVTETATAEKKSPSKLSDSELLTRVRKRFYLMFEADKTNRDLAREDMRFLHVPGAQWDKSVKDARGTRPCYEFNKTRIKAKRIINEMRANRPAGKVRATEDGDANTARVIEGLGRNILQVSDFDTICDYAGEYQVGAGLGAWRIVTDYQENSFNQDIGIKAIPNPFNLFWDPASVDPMHRDAEDWALIDSYSNAAFDSKFGDVAKTNFEGGAEFADEADWRDQQMTRVCEYHWKESYDKRLVQLVDGRVVDAADPAFKLVPVENIKATRIATCHKILMCITSADRILTPATELKGKYHRFVTVHGEWLIIDGKPMWVGVTRYAKDPQRAYNVASTAVTETVATAPNSHYWVTVEQAKGNTEQWNKAISENLPFLQYNPDPKAGPGAPQRVGGADVPVALIQEAQIRDQELKDVMGVYDSSLGDRSNETSGRAIARRNEQGQIVNFNFPDNMAKGKQRTVEIVNDIIPYYYDSARTIRVLGQDGAEEYVKINSAGIDPKTGEPVLLNDLSKGKYDVTVTVGPSFATQRQEAADAFAAMAPQDPQLMVVAPDLVYQAMDIPYADQIAERRRAMLPPEIQALIKQGKDLPPEVKQAKAMIDNAKTQLDQQGQLLQAAEGELVQKRSEFESAESQAKVARAQFETSVAEKNGALDVREANLVLREARLVAKEQATVDKPKMRKIARGRRVNGELIVELDEVPVEPVAPGGNGAAPPIA